MNFLANFSRLPPAGVNRLLQILDINKIPAACASFYEIDKKSGYDTKIKQPIKKTLVEGLGMLSKEVKLYGQELRDKFELDQVYQVEHMDYAYFAKFHSEETVDSWVTTADRDHNEGKSKAHFVLGKENKGLFYGEINTEPPKDGVIKKSGYCSVRSPRRMKSFKRAVPYDYFADFSHLVIRCRGDGRPYLINIGMDMQYDITWNDLFSYPLFTRGGPYWQTSKDETSIIADDTLKVLIDYGEQKLQIPFSKFFKGSKGRIQDRQQRINLDKVSHVGFTCSDQNNGPFRLEIDYVMLLYDKNHTEDFAYESYETTKGIVGN